MNLQQAIDYFGSKSELADATGVSRQAISQWVDIPAARQFQIQLLTKGKLKADVNAAESLSRPYQRSTETTT